MTVIDNELLARHGRTAEVEAADPSRLSVGMQACFWSHFLDGWVGGYTIAEVLPNGYRLARTSDGVVIDELFSGDEVMKERRTRPR